MALRVGTFNIHHGTLGPDGPVVASTLAETTAELDCDILAVQEIDRFVRRSGSVDQVQNMAEAVGAEGAAAKALFVKSVRTGGGESGNALLVRGEVLESHELVLPRLEPSNLVRRLAIGPLRKAILNLRRSAVFARVRVGDPAVDLSVACTHLGTSPFESPRQLRAVLDRLDEMPYPRVLLGDLNQKPGRVKRALRGRGYELLDGPDTAALPMLKRRIDHVAAAGIRIASGETHVTRVGDHAAVVAVLATSSRPAAAAAEEATGDGEWTAGLRFDL